MVKKYCVIIMVSRLVTHDSARIFPRTFIVLLAFHVYKYIIYSNQRVIKSFP